MKMEPTNTEKLKELIYKLVRKKDISEEEMELIERIIEKRDYPEMEPSAE